MTLWDSNTGTPSLVPVNVDGAAVTALSWSTDGRTLAGAAGIGIVLWNPADRVQVGEPLIGHKGSVLTVAWSPDDTHLVSGGSDGTIRLWRRSPNPSGTTSFFPPSGVTVQSVAWSPTARELAAGEMSIRLWTSASAPRVFGRYPDVWSTSLAWAPDGTRLARVDTSGVLEMFDVSGFSEWAVGSSVRPPGDDTGSEGVDLAPTELLAIAWSPDGRLLAGAGKQGTLEFWDATNGKPTMDPITADPGPTETVAWSPDGTAVGSGGAEGSIKLWDPTTGNMTHELRQAHAGAVSALRLVTRRRHLGQRR